MPLLIDSISKICINNSLVINPTKDVLYSSLVGKRTVLAKTEQASKANYSNNSIPKIKLAGMTVEQKRKYLMLKYIRQYT